MALDGRLIPAVFVDEAEIVRIGSRRIGDQPDVGLGTAAAGDGAGVVLGGKLGNVDLQHATRGPGRDESE